jgi:hypothetical protein
MNCCNHDCDQGRDCPAQVAKVGQRVPAAAPLLPSNWRCALRVAAACGLVIIGLSLCAGVGVMLAALVP